MQEKELGDSDEFGVLVHMFAKGSKEQIRVCLNEYKGYNYIDIRAFHDSGSGFRPTKKGVTLPRELFPELFRAIILLGEALGFDEEALARDLESSG